MCSFDLQTGVSCSYVLWSVSHSFTIFVFSRIVGGLSKGNVSLCTAIMADILPLEKRGKGMVSKDIRLMAWLCIVLFVYYISCVCVCGSKTQLADSG